MSAAATEGGAVARPAAGMWSAPAVWLGAICLVVHLVANAHYDVFRDELYFIVCGLHPAFGYVDQPPLIPLIAAASFKLFGTALTPLRLVPALAMSATVGLTADLAARFGGGRFAQSLAGLCALLAPVMLTEGVLLSTDCLQPLTWTACAWIIVRRVQSGDERWWLAFGAVAGASLESKYLIAAYLVALAIGGLATPLRRDLRRPWIYAGAALAIAIAAPSFIWQALHGWPFAAIIGADVGGKSVGQSAIGLLLQQALFVGPASALVWLAGLWRLGARPARPEFRALAIAYIAFAAIVVVANGKAYYFSPIYPSLFAAGGAAWEAWLRRPIARWAAIAIVGIPGLATAPAALPILPPAAVAAYLPVIGMSPAATQTEHMSLGRLPQYFGDMFGWREMAAAVSAVYRDLPPADRAQAVFYAGNYGEAAALDIYGPPLGGPPAISAHNSYFLWGPKGASGAVVIALARSDGNFRPHFDDIEAAGRIDAPFAMPYERGLTIGALRRPHAPLAEVWPSLRHYD